MVIASPRQTHRNLQTVPSEWPDALDHLRMIAQAIRQLQLRARAYPVTVISVTANYTMNDIDVLIKGDATAGDITVTLLSAKAREGRRIIVKKTDSSANLVTIDPDGSETLDGAATISLTQQNAVREYISDGANWQLIGAVGNATGL